MNGGALSPVLAAGFVLAVAVSSTGCLPPVALSGAALLAGSQAQYGALATGGEITKATGMRSGPGHEYPTVGYVPAGTLAVVYGSQGGWYRIQLAGIGPGTEGWVSADSLQTQGASAGGPTARVNTHVNLRSGPGTGHGRVAVLDPGTVLPVSESRDGWHRVNSPQGSGWVHGNYVSIEQPQVNLPLAMFESLTSGTQSRHSRASGAPGYDFGALAQALSGPASDQETAQRAVTPGKQGVEHAGYSLDIQPVKALLVQGQMDAAAELYTRLGQTTDGGGNSVDTASGSDAGRTDETAQQKADMGEIGFQDPLLSALEHGTLSLDGGDTAQALERYTVAEDILEDRRSGTIVVGVVRGVRDFFVENIVGREEIASYKAEGFEKVLMLNYKTIAFLLEGRREAYNVSRRSSDWQEFERQAFEEKLQKAASDKSLVLEREGGQASLGSAEGLMQEAYADGRAKAAEVKSAYVNPFGYYVVGMVNEFESHADPSLRDNARIAYQKALELNPNSAVLRESASAMERKGVGSARVVHVVAGLGFAPEKKTLTYGLPFSQHVIPVKVPVYHSVPSRVARIEARVPGGQRLGTLSPLADIEAITLRHQEDSAPLEVLRVGVTVIRSGIEKRALERLRFAGIGAMLSDMRDATTNPDMRSWQTLPGSLHAVRLELPSGVSRIELRSYDRSGQRLGRTTVDLEPGRHGFVYARGIDGMLVAHASPIRWIQ